MTDQSERTITRIRKLLALAGNNSNENEVQSAMLKAQAMLLQNGLEMQDVAGEIRPGVKEVVETMVDDGGYQGVQGWQLLITTAIAKNFRVTALKYRKGYGHWVLGLVGLRDDVDTAKEVIEFAYEAHRRLSAEYMAEWKRRNPVRNIGLTTRVVNDYLLGFCEGLKQKFTAQVESMALVIIQDDAVIEHLAHMRVGRGQGSRLSRNGDAGAFAQGYEDGSNLSHQRSRSQISA